MPREILIAVVMLACIIIAIGRSKIRQARRQAAGTVPGTAVTLAGIRRGKAMGWMMLGAGTLLMIMAVAGW